MATPRTLTKALDQAIAAENAAFLADPNAQADIDRMCDQMLWSQILRHVYGLGPQMDAEVAAIIARFRESQS